MLKFVQITVALFCFYCYQSVFCQTYPFARLEGSPVDTSGWFLAGDAQIADTDGDTNSLNDEIVLVRPVNTRSGAVFYKKPVNITSCQKWTAEFDFRMWEGTAADGLAFFFLNNPPETYVTGGGMGIPPRPLGLMVCFDTWQNCSANSSGRIPKIQIRYGNGIQNYSECPSPPQPTVTEITSLRSPTYNHAKIVYDFGTISVYLNDSLKLTGNYNIQFAGYFGLTASTGGSTDRHSIRNFVLYTQRPLLVAPDAGPDRILCNGQTTTIGSTNQGNNYTYNWYPVTGLSDSSSQSPQVSLTNPGNTALTVKYFVTKDTVNGGEPRCAFADEVRITVLPRLNQASANIQVCSNVATPVGFSTVPGAGYVWSPATFLSNPLVSNPTFSSSNADSIDRIFNYVVTATHPVGCVETDTVKVRRLGRFADAGADVSLCGSDSIIIGGRTKPDYNYSWFLISPPSLGFQSVILDPQAGKTKAMVTISDSLPVVLKYRQIVLRQDFNCLNDDTVQVKVYPEPKAIRLPDVQICPEGTTVIGLPGNPQFSYQWQQQIGVENLNAAQTNLAGQPVTESFDTLYFRLKAWADFQSCRVFDSSLIRFKRSPDIFRTPDKIVCKGFPAVLGAGTPDEEGYSYEWQPADFLTATDTGTVTFQNPDASDTTFQYVLKNILEGCEITDSVKVVVQAVPIFPNLNPFAVCPGSARKIGPDSLPGYRYQWLNPTGLNNPFTAQPDVRLLYDNSQSGGLLYYPITTTNLSTTCQRTDTVRILLQPAPEAFAGNDTTLCSGDTIWLGNPSANPADVFSWTGNGFFVNPGQPSPRFVKTGDVPETVLVSLLQTNGLGCRDYDTVRIEFRPSPKPEISTEGKRWVCRSDSIFTYSHTVSSGSVYEWAWTGGQVIENATGSIRINWVSDPARLVLKEKDSFGCRGISPEWAITVSPKPTGVLSGPDFICPGSYEKTYQLQGNALVGSALAVGGIVIETLPFEKDVVVRFDSLSTFRQLRVVPKSTLGCPGDTIVKVPAFDLYNPVLLSASVSEPGTVEIQTEVPSSGYLPVATVSDGNINASTQNMEGKAIAQFTNLNTQKPLRVTLSGTDRCGIERTAGVHQIMTGKASANVLQNRLDVLCEWTTYLGAEGPVTYELYWFSSSGNDFTKVAEVDVLRSLLSGFPEQEKPIFKVRAFWKRNNRSLESWSDVFSLDVKKPELVFPNLVTANNDGLNDGFVIPFLNWYPDAKLKIFNRWGNEVFQSQSYQNNWKPEDGQEGMYFFELTASGKAWKGWIQVVN